MQMHLKSATLDHWDGSLDSKWSSEDSCEIPGDGERL